MARIKDYKHLPAKQADMDKVKRIQQLGKQVLALQLTQDKGKEELIRVKNDLASAEARRDELAEKLSQQRDELWLAKQELKLYEHMETEMEMHIPKVLYEETLGR